MEVPLLQTQNRNYQPNNDPNNVYYDDFQQQTDPVFPSQKISILILLEPRTTTNSSD